MPMRSVSSATQRAQSTDMPGLVGPVSVLLIMSSWVVRLDQPVRHSSQPPAGSGPCSSTQASTCSRSMRKLGSASTWATTSITAAGRTNAPAGTREMSARSLPVTQWLGASKWVPVCSPVRKLFQYQAGPRSS